MVDVALSVLVDRTSLPGSPAALELNDAAAGRKVVSLAPGGEEWELAADAGGAAHGDDVTHARMVSTEAIIVVRFSASSVATLNALVTTAKTALRQQGFGISGTLKGEAFSWARCWPRKFDPVGIDGSGGGGEIEKFGYVSAPYKQAWMFTLHRSPVAISGPW